MEERHVSTIDDRDIDELLHHDHYTVEEAAFLLGMDSKAINQAAHRHELVATCVDHHVISLRSGTGSAGCAPDSIRGCLRWRRRLGMGQDRIDCA